MKIVADPNIPFVLEAFGPLGHVVLVPGRTMTAHDVRDADCLLVRSVTAVNAALLEGSRVRFVATATIGTDHVDTAYLAGRGIGFASAAGSNANSVAEYVVAALLELAHRKNFRLRDKTLGVVGVGNVGSKVVRYAEALGMRVLQNDPPRQRSEGLNHFVSLERVLTEADIVTLHVPLTRTGTDATYHLFEPRRGIIINTARGAVLDNRALLQAPLEGLVLDVWENEPDLLPGLLQKTDIGTPHIAGYSFDGKVNGTRMIYEATCSFFGLMPNWQPQLPPPPVPKVELDATGLAEEEALRRVVSSVYDITADDRALRAAPHQFDRLRAEYPVRREFFNTAVLLRNAPEQLRQMCAALGFKLQ
ncbi:MAG: 4-phosphoerythronate dehydrogenase [Verrucomicrobiae bacterium]|nr:4-phosphoerythronate dehydrogenase [Verrucomicrobiae bacterium]